MKTKTFIVILLAVVLTSCKSNQIERGIVVEKQIVPTHKSVYYNVPLKMPMTKIVPTSYRLVVQDGDIIETFNVSEMFYSSISVGDSIMINNSSKNYDNLN